MISIFDVWENVYDAVIEACSQDSIRCCSFAIKLADQINQIISHEKVVQTFEIYVMAKQFINFIRNLRGLKVDL